MMKRVVVFLLVSLVACGACFAKELSDADKAEKSVHDYEERIERIAREVEAIRDELESLAREMVEGETGRVLVFMKGKASDWSDRGITVAIDSKIVFSRPLTTSELDVLSRGLALELFETRLGAGEHEVSFYEMGMEPMAPVNMTVKRARLNSWIANPQGEDVEWEME